MQDDNIGTSNPQDEIVLAKRFIRIFRGLQNARGAVNGACIKGALTLTHVIRHLEGKESLGRYPLFNKKFIQFAAGDFDFKASANRAAISERHAKEFAQALFDLGIKHYWFERSKSGLIHLWLLFSEPVLAKKVRYVLLHIAKALGLKISAGIVEIFPKQDEIEEGQYGNYINLPYYGALNGGRSERRVMIDPNTFLPIPLEEFLLRVDQTLISPTELDAVFESLAEDESQDELEDEADSANRQSRNGNGEYSETSWQIKREKIMEIIRPYWVEPNRDALTYHLSDLLCRNQISEAEAWELILETAKLCKDKEWKKRRAVVSNTYKKRASGRKTNYKDLKNILSPEDFDALVAIFNAYVFVEGEDESEQEASSQEPVFPSSVITGLIKDYLDTVSSNSETSHTVHFGTFTSYMSLRLGRDIHYLYPRPMYPVLWSCNVNRTGQRRSTGLAYAYDLSAGVPLSEFHIISGIASAEGIINLFGDIQKDGKNRTAWTPHLERQVLLNLNEATVVLKVSKREATSNLREILHNFYDYVPYVENPTKQSSMRAVNPCLGLVSATTYGALKESFKEAEVTSGFFNRLCFYIGTPRKVIAHPAPPNPDDMAALKQRIARVVNFGKKVRKEHMGKMVMSPEAAELWTGYYKDFRDKEEALDDDLDRDMIQRLHVFAIKFSMLYAAMDERRVISVDDLHKGNLIANHLGENALWILKTLVRGESKYARLENRLLKFFKENEGQLFSCGRLHQVAGGYYERTVLLRALDTLVAAGLIVEVKKRVRRQNKPYWGVVR